MNTMNTLRASVAGLTSIALLAAATSVAQAEETTGIRQVTQQCKGQYYLWSASFPLDASDVLGKVASISPSEFKVTAPATVTPGQEFSVTVAPGRMKVTSDYALGRIKYDLRLPEGVTNVRATVEGAEGLMAGSTQPQAHVVDEEGNDSPTGGFVRVDGGATVSNGPSAKLYDPQAGLRYGPNTEFSLPAVTVTMTAPRTAGADLSVGLRGAGSQPAVGGSDSFLSFGAHGQGWTSSNYDLWCTPGEEATKLSSTRVVGDTAIAFTQTDLDVITGTENTTLTAKVSTSASNTELLKEGKVEFYVDGQLVGTLSPNEQGVAEMTYSFDKLKDRTKVEHSVTARYTGVGTTIAPSQDEARLRVTVNPIPLVDVDSTATIAVFKQVADPHSQPLRIVGTITPSNGATLPKDAQVQLLRDGQLIETKPTNGTDNTVEFTDTMNVPESAAQKATYTVKLLNTIDESRRFNFLAAESASESVSVAPVVATTTALEVSQHNVAFRTPVDLTATVSAGATLPAGASVQFRNNGRDLGQAVPIGAEGVALAPAVVLPEGSNMITAHYFGVEVETAVYQGSKSDPIEVTVGAKPSQTTATTIEVAAHAVQGEDVTMTATVTGEDAAAFRAFLRDNPGDKSGSVAFFIEDKLVGFAPLSVTDDGAVTATLTTGFPTSGTLDVSATYTGAASEEAVVKSSTSDSVPVAVSPAQGIAGKTPAKGSSAGDNWWKNMGIWAGVLAGGALLTGLIAYLVSWFNNGR